MVVSEGDKITPGDLPSHLVDGAHPNEGGAEALFAERLPSDLRARVDLLFPSTGSLTSMETLQLAIAQRAVTLHDGNMVRTARALGIGRATLYRWLRRSGPEREIE